MGKHKYANEEITVTWDSDVCIHAAECVKSLGTVFDVSKKPWINVDAESPAQIAVAIKRCPSGALQYAIENKLNINKEENMTDLKITISKNGPYLVKGDVEVVNSEGKKIETKETFALCRCGASQNKPFCDGSHKRVGFEG